MWALDTDLTTEQLATNEWSYMEDTGAQDVQGASNQKIGDCSGYQVYGYYPADDTYLVTWFFETSYDNYKHYCAVEFTSDNFWAFDMVQNNYSSNGSTTSTGSTGNTGSTGSTGSTGNTGSTGSTGASSSSSFDGRYVDGTLNNPAKLNEWIKIKMYNPVSDNDDECYVRITGVVSGAAVDQAIAEYEVSHTYLTINELEYDDLEYMYYTYDVYFPNEWEARDYGISSPDADSSITNTEGSSRIGNYILGSAWEITPDEDDQEVHPGGMYHGKKLYAMVKGNTSYYVEFRTYIDGTKYTWYINPNR